MQDLELNEEAKAAFTDGTLDNLYTNDATDIERKFLLTHKAFNRYVKNGAVLADQGTALRSTWAHIVYQY